MSVSRKELEVFLNRYLETEKFDDYGPNGLQIEGREKISKLAYSVSATRFSIEQGIASGADALIVHHGLFWKFHGVRSLTGTFGKRVIPAVRAELNLFAYHLPLDAHMEVGNAAVLAKKVGLKDLKPFGPYKGAYLGVQGQFENSVNAKTFEQQLELILGHSVLHSSPDDEDNLTSLGIITGGARNDWNMAMDCGLDAFLTGEMSEHNWNESKESGIHMYAGGHYATERFGIEALVEKITESFDVETFKIDEENPA